MNRLLVAFHHDLEHGLDERQRHFLEKQVAHAIDKNDAPASPPLGQVEQVFVAEVHIAVEQRPAVDDVRYALVLFLMPVNAVLVRQVLRKAVQAVAPVHPATGVGYPGAAAVRPANAAVLRHVPAQHILSYSANIP